MEETDRADGSAGGAFGSVATLLSHLVVGVVSLIAGVVLGGWLAFETGYWRAFRAWIEVLGDGAMALAVGLGLVAVGVSLVVAYARTGR